MPPPTRSIAMNGPLKPQVTLLVKLGSIAVHADEMLSPDGHEFDRISIQQLLHDPEVVEWIKDMAEMLPLKRK